MLENQFPCLAVSVFVVELPDPGPCITCLHITDCPRPDLRLYPEFESNHRNVLSFSASPPLGILRQVKKAVSNKTTAFFVTKLFLVLVFIKAGEFLYRYQECLDFASKSNNLMDHFLYFLHFDPVLLNFLSSFIYIS